MLLRVTLGPALQDGTSGCSGMKGDESMIVQGRVIKRRIAAGTKSEHDAVMLLSTAVRN